MTELSDFPNEILAKVLGWLQPGDILKATEVCRCWCAVVDVLVGVHKYVGRDTQMWPGEKYEPLHILGEVGIQNLVISDLSNNPEAIPELKHPHLVRDVWVDESACPKSLKKVLDPLVNLRSLIFHLSALGDFQFAQEHFVLAVPSLTSFTISLYGIGQQQLQTDYFEDWKIPNLLEILHNARLPSLKNLSLHLPLALPFQEQLSCAVITMTSRHAARLEKLLVNFEFTTRVELDPDLEAAMMSYPLYDQVEAASRVTGLSLKKLFVHCARQNRSMMGVYHKILYAQTQTLRKLHLTTGYYPLPIEALENNCSSLTAVQLTLTTTDDEQPLDLHCFRSCCRLKILTLVGPHKFELPPLPIDEDGPRARSLHDVFSTRADLVGVRTGLSPSLEAVRIFNLYLQSADADFIVGGSDGEGLPAVKLVSLHNIGTGCQLGLSLRSIASIMERKKILFFATISGINVASLSNPNPNQENEGHSQSSFATLAGLLLKSMEPCGFVLQLDPTSKTYTFGTQINPSLPVTTDPKVIIDAEVNIDFAIENDDLFEAEEDEGDEQIVAAFALGAAVGVHDDDDDGLDFGGEEEDEDDWEDVDHENFDEPAPNLPMPIGLPLALPLLAFSGFSEEEEEEDEDQHEEEAFADAIAIDRDGGAGDHSHSGQEAEAESGPGPDNAKDQDQ